MSGMVHAIEKMKPDEGQMRAKGLVGEGLLEEVITMSGPKGGERGNS